VEVHQAYSFLMNASQRKNYERILSDEKMSASELEHRERIYKLWVEHQQKKARTRDAMSGVYPELSDTEDDGNFWSRFNVVYNGIFLLLFAAMFFVPIYAYFDQKHAPMTDQASFLQFVIPSVVCGIFAVVGFYYWFILKTDKE